MPQRRKSFLYQETIGGGGGMYRNSNYQVITHHKTKTPTFPFIHCKNCENFVFFQPSLIILFSAKATLSGKYKKYAAAQNITGFSQKAVTCGTKRCTVANSKEFCQINLDEKRTFFIRI